MSTVEQTKTEIEHLYKVGAGELSLGNIEASREIWLRLIEIDKNPESALQNLAQCELQLEEFEEALKIASDGVARFPANNEFRRIRAEANYNLLNFGKVVEDTGHCLAKTPDDEHMLGLAVQAATFLGDMTLVRQLENQGLKYFPQALLFRFVQCKLLFLDKKFDEAEKLVGELIQDFPEEDDIYGLATEIFLETKKLSQAEQLMTELVKDVRRRSPLNLNNLAMILFAREKYSEAAKVAEESLSILPEQTEAPMIAGHSYFKLEKTGKAEYYADLAVANNELDIRAWELKLLVAYQLDNKPMAKEVYEKIHQLDPEGVSTMGEYARRLADEGWIA